MTESTDRGLLQRITRTAKIPDVLDALSERLAPSDLQFLLLALYERLAGQVTPRRVLEQYARDRFVRPAAVDPRRVAEADALAWRLLPEGFEPVELGPLCPLGTCSAVAAVHQNKVVSTSRNTEVVSDSTNVLALECAVRRRQNRAQVVKLASSHRMTRAQALPVPRSWAHFRLLSLVAAGRDEGTFVFEAPQLVEQVAFYLRFLEGLRTLGFGLVGNRVALTDVTNGKRTPQLEEQVLHPLSERFPEARFEMDPQRQSGRGYYTNVCFKLFAQTADRGELEIGDGGDVDWTQKLLSDRKERLVISGFGTERILAR